MSSSTPIRFWDIATKPPVEKTCCSPNPWKARFALNFKKVPYTTLWTPTPDITKVRRELDVPAVRHFADGTDFCTLPLVHDPSTGKYLGDSFDIAEYLQKQYPEAGAGDLFPPQKLDYEIPKDLVILVPLTEVREGDYRDYAQFNVNVDAAFTAHVQLTTQGFPFDPKYEEATKAEFVRRAGGYVSSWEGFYLEGEARATMLASFEKMLEGLAAMFKRDASGPFLLGQKANYADCIVGGWLRMMSVTLRAEEWETVRGWHDGVFGKLHDALREFAEVK